MEFKDDVSLVISGAAGQGVNTLENILSTAVKTKGYYVFTYSEVMSRIRGGNNSLELRISSEKKNAFLDRIDMFIPMNDNAMSRFEDRIAKNTAIIGDKSHIDDRYQSGDYTTESLPLVDLAKEIGGKIYFNTIILGFLCCMLGIEEDILSKVMKEKFSRLDEDKLEKNWKAMKEGYNFCSELVASGKLTIKLKPDKAVGKSPLIRGVEAIGVGCLAGGCDFVSSYPMSPSTDLIQFMARQAGEFGVVVEQAEDEICAMNMGLGSWYAGGRAMVTTAGGGFALMVEGLSLAGMIESPMVIHLGQRPAPATGLPTRTEQADLNLALYGGHGEFPRAIFAPGTPEDGVELSARAFDMADKYQVPVFILTDQYYLDSLFTMDHVDVTKYSVEKRIHKTEKDYRRYSFTENGISPRGIPGNGDGIVCLDSDEHDEGGYITESFDMRNRMMEKRMGRLEGLTKDSLPPEVIGKKNAKAQVVCWGSQFPIVREAVSLLGRDDVSVIYFKQVYPLHEGVKDLLGQAEKRIIVENNYSSQFAALVKRETGLVFHDSVLKYSGMPFSVEEVHGSLKKILK